MIFFGELGLSQPVLQAISRMGFEAATPIQEQAFVSNGGRGFYRAITDRNR